MLRFFSWVLLLVANGLQADGNTGTTVVRRHTAGDHTSEFTTYTMGDRQRTESRNSVQYKNADGLLVTVDPPANVSITRCDLGQSFALNTKTMEYTSAAYPPGPLPPEKVAERELMERKAAETALPTLRIELTTVDIGDRKEMFGYMARHVITTIKETYLEGSDRKPEEYVTDGWYIDFDQEISCEPKVRETTESHSYLWTGRGPLAKTEYVEIGVRERGFAVKEVQTSRSTTSQGVRNSSTAIYESEITELVEGPLKPDLFEVPADFKHVEHIP